MLIGSIESQDIPGNDRPSMYCIAEQTLDSEGGWLQVYAQVLVISTTMIFNLQRVVMLDHVRDCYRLIETNVCISFVCSAVPCVDEDRTSLAYVLESERALFLAMEDCSA